MSIAYNQVSKQFQTGIFRKTVKAVSELTLSIEKGEVFGIIGPNGAGKSTLLKMLMGFMKPSSGSISVMGKSPYHSKTKRLIGYLPENPYYYDHLSAEELMRFSAKTSGMSGDDTERRIDELLEIMSLGHARKRKLRGYSKGMTQRAGICFALVHDPELIILDEPMSGLDPIGRKDVVNLVLDLKKQKKTVLFCSHILNDVERLCDRMAIMNKGRLCKVMPKSDLVGSSKTVSIFCSKIPKEHFDTVSSLGAEIAEYENGHMIHCPQTILVDIFQFLIQNDIVINGIDPSADALEKLFFEAIEEAEA